MIRFSLDALDDEGAVGVLPYIADLGLIEVKIVRSTGGRIKPWKPSSTAQAENFGPIHETTKKAGMHCIAFGPAVRSVQINCRHGVMLIDEWSAPYVTFKFYYRPLEILQAQGIVEAIAVEPPMDPANITLGGRDAPSPVPPPQDSSISLRRKQQDEHSHLNSPAKRPRRDGHASSPFANAIIEDLSTKETGDVKPPDVKDEVENDADDVEAIEAQMQALRERLDRAKTKRARGSQPPRFVKRESSPIRVGQFNGGVIDLTSD
ncbi:hypothetical protein DAEQUDRAFT_763401 [Daedalea quercina L-15889]|uniref:DUF7918 domain-containing protein n=1 Tax=Daedalea quercina L-15889 TaxID=1314783 RepID=A0A165SFP4_9APHY|nr:hypothetical protein DAEQUDRAFT_763401 [Daedalea quercina L-15889]